MQEKKLLITGFEPFHGEVINPSWEAVSLLPEQVGPWRLTKLRLPVVFGKGAALAEEAARKLSPQGILSVGQAGGRDSVTPELVAVNLRNASIPDNEGNMPQGEAVVPGGWDGYFSTVPARELAQKLSRQGLPCKLSYTAGTYVCNDVFYTLLHRFREEGVPVGFVHVPFLPEQAGEGQPSMAIEEIARVLEALILALE